MAHSRDKPHKEKRRPKKAKPVAPAPQGRGSEILSHVSGQDQHRWTTEQKENA